MRIILICIDLLHLPCYDEYRCANGCAKAENRLWVLSKNNKNDIPRGRKWRRIMLNYIKGMDISSLDEIEKLGAKFYDDGKEGDLIEILKRYGTNCPLKTLE